MPKCPPGIPRTPPHSTPPSPPPLHPPPPPLPPRPPYPLPHHPSTDPLPRQVRAHYICLARAGKHKVPPTDPLATLFCNGHMPFSVSLPWLREAVRLDRRRAQALPQAPSNVGRPFAYMRRTRPLWKHPPPQPSVLRTKTNRCPPLCFLSAQGGSAASTSSRHTSANYPSRLCTAAPSEACETCASCARRFSLLMSGKT